VRVSPHVYKIVVDEAVMDAAGLNGHCDHDQGVIRYSEKQSASQIRETFLHEILHACFWNAGLTADVGGPDDEEKLINKLAPRVLAMMRDNKGLVRWLTG
jgi:hypothetical protein